jgi:hypothetical protein
MINTTLQRDLNEKDWTKENTDTHCDKFTETDAKIRGVLAEYFRNQHRIGVSARINSWKVTLGSDTILESLTRLLSADYKPISLENLLVNPERHE